MKLSIIIPTIGRSTLPQVLEGIIHSKNFKQIQPEILIIFDHKDPKLFQNKYLENKPPAIQPYFRFYQTKHKSYAGGARNLGLDKAKGDIITFLGDDTIPDKNWLAAIDQFHQENPNSNQGLLGRITWPDHLAGDPFHQWLENHAQFTFHKIKRRGATWRNFYTSNISLKKEFIGKNRFADQFQGWGFEDIEFGYRLSQKGLDLHYNENCRVYHHHTQKLKTVIENTRNARKNARIFESLHPGIKILPRGGKKILLQILIILTVFLPKRWFPKVYWWREWKKAWMKTPLNRQKKLGNFRT